jgi:hypothetical protein
VSDDRRRTAGKVRKRIIIGSKALAFRVDSRHVPQNEFLCSPIEDRNRSQFRGNGVHPQLQLEWLRFRYEPPSPVCVACGLAIRRGRRIAQRR